VRVNLTWRDELPVRSRGRGIREARGCSQRKRFLEAMGVPRLNPQSPSKLGWRLHVRSRQIHGFDNIMDLKHTISLMDPAAAGPLPERGSASA